MGKSSEFRNCVSKNCVHVCVKELYVCVCDSVVCVCARGIYVQNGVKRDPGATGTSCRQAPRLPHKVEVDDAKCHPCHTNSCGDNGVKRDPSATRASCRQVPRLPHKVKVDVAKCFLCGWRFIPLRESSDFTWFPWLGDIDLRFAWQSWCLRQGWLW